MDTDNFSISHTIKNKTVNLKNKPYGLFFKNKNKILSKNYELSIVFIGRKKSQMLNKKYRKKDKPAGILAFPLSKSAGEIFICPEIVKLDAPKFNMKKNEFMLYLFIHGLLHLKGFKHGRKMEKEEKKLIKF